MNKEFLVSYGYFDNEGSYHDDHIMYGGVTIKYVKADVKSTLSQILNVPEKNIDVFCIFKKVWEE